MIIEVDAIVEGESEREGGKKGVRGEVQGRDERRGNLPWRCWKWNFVRVDKMCLGELERN